MLFPLLFLLTSLAATSSAWAIPAWTSDVSYTQNAIDRRDVLLDSATTTDDDDVADDDDSCPTDAGLITSSFRPIPTSDALPSALSPSSNLTGLDNDLGTACVPQNGLSKRACNGRYKIRYGDRQLSITYRDLPQKDTLYIKARSNGKWYPVSSDSDMVIRRKFVDRFTRDCIQFIDKDRDGADMYFIFTPGGKDGEGRFSRGFERDGYKIVNGVREVEWSSVRPLVLSSDNTDLSLRWGRSSEDGSREPEGIPRLWDDETGDGIKEGYDRNGVALTKHWLQEIERAIPIYKRCALFYTGSGVDSDMMNSFIHSYLRGKGFTYFDVFGDNKANYARLLPFQRYGQYDDDYEKMKFMGIYRGSRAVAQMTRYADVYVVMQYMLPDGRRRSIFDRPEKKWNGNPLTIGTGQVWWWVELPILLRNPYVKRIWAVMPDPYGKWTLSKQWDISDPNAYKVERTWPTPLDKKVQVNPIPGTA